MRMLHAGLAGILFCTLPTYSQAQNLSGDINSASPDATPPDEQSHAINTAIVPVPKLELEDHSYDWYKRHRQELTEKDQIRPQIVMIGDSITHFWAGPPKDNHINGPHAWNEAFGDLPVLNLGFGYDRTQNVLWRLDHGEFDGLTPKWVVLNIGTNNLHGDTHARENTPQEVVDAILAICDRVHAISPTSHIVVMGIFPRGEKASDPARAKISAVNDILSDTLKSHLDITYLDIGAQFLQPDGSLPKDMMFDGTHPTDKGYSLWAKALLDAGIRN